MKRQNVLLAAGLALVAVALILSCGGSDNGTNPYTKVTGDPNDKTYRTALGEVSFSVHYTQGMLKDIFLMMGEISPDVFGAAKTGSYSALGVAADTAEWHQASQYWVRAYVDTTDTIQKTYFSYVDSIQFLEGSSPVQYPDSLAITAVKVSSRHRLSYGTKSDSVMISLDATLAGQAGALARRGNITINGIGFYAGLLSESNVQGPDTACSYMFAFSIKHQDVHVNIGNVYYGHECPTSGVVRHTGVMISDCHGPSDSLDYEKQWTAVTTYDGPDLKFTIENPSTRWVFQTTCAYIGAPKQPGGAALLQAAASGWEW